MKQDDMFTLFIVQWQMLRSMNHLLFTSSVIICHIMSHCVTLCHIVSHYVTSCHIMSHCVTLCHLVSHCVTSCHIMSHYVTLCHIVSHCVMSCYYIVVIYCSLCGDRNSTTEACYVMLEMYYCPDLGHVYGETMIITHWTNISKTLKLPHLQIQSLSRLFRR